MATTRKKTGTSLKTLGPYMAHDIEVEINAQNAPAKEHGVLKGIWQSNGSDTQFIDIKPHDGENWLFELKEIMPILYPFSQLCDTMPDGKVPAVEVAKYIYSLSDNPIELDEHENVHAGFGHFQELVVMVGGCGLICIYPDWRIDTYGNCLVPPLVYDYLRSLHFAVGLEPHEFIEKAAPTPTIQGGGKSHE